MVSSELSLVKCASEIPRRDVEGGGVQQRGGCRGAEEQSQPREPATTEVGLSGHHPQQAGTRRPANDLPDERHQDREAERDQRRTPDVVEHGGQKKREAEERRSSNQHADAV